MKKTLLALGTLISGLSILLLGFTGKTKNESNTQITGLNQNLFLENQTIYGPQVKVVPDLNYDIDTRFTGIKKIEIDKASTLYDFLDDEEEQQIAELNSVNIIIIKDNRQSEIYEYGTTDELTEAQLQLLKATDYFSHFTVRAEFKEKNTDTGKLEARFFGPHITVVPNNEAFYVPGKEALIRYLKNNSMNDMYAIDFNNLGAIKISFIITKEGAVSDVKHDAMSTNHKFLDEKFMTLIKNIPGRWTPAENTKGEKIDQELVFTFGPANGC